MLDTGQNPQLSIKLMRESCLETLNNFATWMEAVTKEACSTLSQAADDMAHFYDTHFKEAPLYEVREKVWLNGQNITTTHPMKKLYHKWIRQYVVDKVILQKTYRLKLPPSLGQTHPVFSVTLLWPY